MTSKHADQQREIGQGCEQQLWRRIFAAQRWPAIDRKIEWAIFTVMCLLALWLNIVLYCHCGAFWRDETSAIHLASAPDWSTMWSWLPRDAFPWLFSCLLRLWITVGPGTTDAGIRLFGTCTALGLLAALFVSGRMFVGRVPLLAMAMVAFNTAVFYYNSSIRAYGVAVLFIVLCFAAFWRMVQNPSRWNVAASLLLAIASWHVNYQNTYLLFGIVASGAIVCAVCRLWKRCALVLGIGFAAAVSMLIYIPIVIQNRDVHRVTSFATDFQLIVTTFSEAIAGKNRWLLVVSLLLILAACVFLSVDIVRQFRCQATRRIPSRSLFCLLATVIAVITGIIFFKMHGMYPRVWHYTPFIAFMGILVEVGAATIQKAWMVWGRMVVAALIVALSLPGMWTAAHTRRTNMDIVSRVLANKAGPNDFILVNPFYLSPGFDYYYRGDARWDILPSTPEGLERKISSYLAMKQSMVVSDPVAPTLEEIKQSLASGGRLWIVGKMPFMPPNTLPPTLPPAPHSPYKWDSNVYSRVWSMQVGYYLQTHAHSIQRVPVKVEQPVNVLENLLLILVEGWRL